MILSVDGTPSITYTFNAASFAGTDFNNIGINSLAAWAQVFDNNIPGITAQVINNTISLTSNLGFNSNASLTISNTSTLVTNGMFSVNSLTSTGATSDYTLNRNLGQIKLTNVLQKGDVLQAGDVNTQAYSQSASISAPNSIAFSTNPNWWITVDGQAKIIPISFAGFNPLTISQPYGNPTVSGVSNIIRFTSSLNTFANVLAGDYLIVWDPTIIGQATPVIAAASGSPGMAKISRVDIGGTWIEFESPYVTASYTTTTPTPTSTGIVIVRTKSLVQQISVNKQISGVNYTLDNLASTLNTSLLGCVASNYNNSYLRLSSNTLESNGDIMVVTADVAGQTLGFTLGGLSTSTVPHLPVVENQNSDLGTPWFNWYTASSPNATLPITFTSSSSIQANSNITWLKSFPINSVNVSSSSGASTDVITTATPHGFATGQYVFLHNSTNNGVFGPITYASATTFSVTTGNAAGGSGYVYSWVPANTVKSLSVSGNTITITTANNSGTQVNHGLSNGMYVQISECQNPIFNGTFGPISGCTPTATGVNGNSTFTYTQTGLPSNVSAPVVTPTTVAIANLVPVPSEAPKVTTNTGDFAQNKNATGTSIIERQDNSQAPPSVNDRFYQASPFSITPRDNLALILDQNTNLDYNLNIYRNIGPATSTSYGNILSVIDSDNSSNALSSAFGTSFSFNDYAVAMNARAKSYDSSYATAFGTGGPSNTSQYYNKGALWRYQRMGAEGNNVTVSYGLPTSPSASTSLTTYNNINNNINLQINLPSGAARTGYNLASTNSIASYKDANGGSVAVTVNADGTSVGTVTLTSASINLAVGQVFKISGTTHFNGNWVVATISSVLSSGIYNTTITFATTLPNQVSAESGTLTVGVDSTVIGNTYYTGFSLPTGKLQTIGYTISSWAITSGTPNLATVTLIAPSNCTGVADTLDRYTNIVKYGWYNISGGLPGTPLANVGASGNILVFSLASNSPATNSFVTISGTGGALDGLTFPITSIATATDSNSHTSLKVTFNTTAAVASGTSGTITSNTVVAFPTLPVGDIFDLTTTYLAKTHLTTSNTAATIYDLYVVPTGSVDSNYPAGYKAAAAISTLTFSYVDGSVTTPATANSTQPYGAELSPIQFPATPGFSALGVPNFSSSILAGDIVNFSTSNLNPPAIESTSVWPVYSHRINQVAPQWFQLLDTNTSSANNTINPVVVNSSSYYSFFPLTNPTVNSIITAINGNTTYSAILKGVALADAGDTGGATAGTGTLTMSTLDEQLIGTATFGSGAVSAYPCLDGINWVQTSTLSSSPNTLLLKNAVSTILESSLGNNLDNDYTHEVFKLVPITSSNIIKFINSQAVSGLSTTSELLNSSDYSKISVASDTSGSLGSVEVSGGTANAASATLVGSGATITSGANTYGIVTANTSALNGFEGNQWVNISSTNTIPKVTGWNTTTQFTIQPGPWCISGSSLTSPYTNNAGNINSVDRYITFNTTWASGGIGRTQYQISAKVVGSNLLVSLSGSGSPTWQNNPKIGDMAIISSSSQISAGLNTGSYYVQGVTSNSLTLIPVSGQSIATINSGNPVAFGSSPQNDIACVTSISIPDASSALITIAGSSMIAGQTSGSVNPVINHNAEWQIEKVGNYVSYSTTARGTTSVANNASSLEGTIAHINVTGFNPNNTGFFQVIATPTTNTSFWISNPNVIEEDKQQTSVNPATNNLPSDFINFYTYDSVIPGDSLYIGSTLLGSANQGTWTVTQIVPPLSNASTYTQFIIHRTDGKQFTLESAVSGVSTGAVQVLPQNPLSMIKQIAAIGPNSTSLGTLSDIILTTSPLVTKITSTGNFTMTGLDKLNFPTTLNQGIDAYKVATGIIAEANKTIYGVASDPILYPGVASSGSNINIEGPKIRAINVSLGVRYMSGVAISIVEENIKSAVASVVNSTKLGTQLALGSIINAAMSVSGVSSAVLMEPQFTSSNDIIQLQPYEKPLILNIDSDIIVTQIT